MNESQYPQRMNVSSPGYSRGALALAVVFSILATVVAVLAVFHILGAAPWSNPTLVQHGKVETKGESMGIVYFETPYASPPQLALNTGADLGNGYVVKCAVVDQNEVGFVWQLLINGRPEPDPAHGPGLKANWHDWMKGGVFSWEAKGVKGIPGAATTKLTLPLDKTVTVEGEDFLEFPKSESPNEKVIHFKVAFKSPPYMTFPDGMIYGYKIVDQKADSFKLQRAIPKEDRNNGTLEKKIPGGVLITGPAPRSELFGGTKLRWKAEGQPAK